MKGLIAESNTLYITVDKKNVGHFNFEVCNLMSVTYMAVVVSKGPMSFNAQWPRSFCPWPGIPLCSCTSLTVWAISMSFPHVYTVLHANVSRQLCVTLLAHSLMWVAWSVNRLCRWDGTRKEVFCIVSLFVRVIEKKMKSLFELNSHLGWAIEGPMETNDGTLVLEDYVGPQNTLMHYIWSWTRLTLRT